ncbi:MAG: aldo/keto reductase [Bacteroidetes bacterium]|nr:aldo/keto reductase [Bacteroidota bacterium]MCL5025301.1 aldo/keto reductase [Chloroflexota bacterium]
MKQRCLGKTGALVSRVGFGGIPIQRLQEEEAIAVVQSVLDMGVTFIDTANSYSNSEERIGKALAACRPGRRGEIFLATKTNQRSKAGAAEHLSLSLHRLQTNYIDLYQFHNVADADTMAQVLGPGGAYEAVAEAKAAGLVRHIGVSSHSPETAKQLVKSGKFETIQFPFNFITRELGEELLPLTVEHNVGFIAMKPLDGGTLDRVDLAFKYLLQFPNVVPDPGIDAPEQMRQIIDIAEGDLTITAQDLADMEAIRAEVGTRHCRRCGYCQPCPTDISIPQVLSLPASFKRSSPARFFSPKTQQNVADAEQCTECGQCEEQCPYRLPIREMLKAATAFYREKELERAGVSP